MPQRLAAIDSAPRSPRWNLALSCYERRGEEKDPLASRTIGTGHTITDDSAEKPLFSKIAQKWAFHKCLRARDF